MASTSRKARVGRAAMIMAAGLGTRMRPLTEHRPKALVAFDGKALIDHALARLRRAEVRRAVVNVHYRAEMVEAHLAAVSRPEIVISDEREGLMDTGGGLVKARAQLGTAPFFVVNVDSLWVGGTASNLERLRAAWDGRRMDCLMLLAPTVGSLGYEGCGDFVMDPHGKLRRPKPSEVVPFAHTGVYLMHPRLLDDAPKGPFSANLLWDRALDRGRLYGLRIDGTWLHLGSPEALAEAEALIDEMVVR